MDPKTSSGRWLLPTRNRPGNLKRFFDHCQLVGLSTPGWVLVNKDDWEANRHAYLDLQLPSDWAFVVQDTSTLSETFETIWSAIEGFDWVGVVCDDNVPATPGWDTSLLNSIEGWNFVTCNDNWQAPARATGAYVFSGDWLRAVGHLTLPGCKHLFMDDMWETLGRATDTWTVRMDVLVKHEHYLQGTAKQDSGYSRVYDAENFRFDKRAFEAWQVQHLPTTVERLEALKQRYGVAKRTFDVSNVSIMIATPIADGKPEAEYVGSLLGTALMLNQKNIPFTWVVESGNADIVAARAELLGTFLESGFSHLLMIDADMGWDSAAVARLLYARKDFVAVAGRRKRDSPTYALNPLSRDGKFADIRMEEDSASCEVLEVGMAFVLLTRACAERMVEGHPDLRYFNASGAQRCAVFSPMITEERHYKAEDYAFCRRWRALGGQIHVCPDISLKHIGKKSWEGAWSSIWEQAKDFQPAAEVIHGPQT